MYPQSTKVLSVLLVVIGAAMVVSTVARGGSDADCSFGHNVNATGTYKKIRSGKPKFEPPI